MQFAQGQCFASVQTNKQTNLYYVTSVRFILNHFQIICSKYKMHFHQDMCCATGVNRVLLLQHNTGFMLFASGLHSDTVGSPDYIVPLLPAG
jgi:hypothetical protein